MAERSRSLRLVIAFAAVLASLAVFAPGLVDAAPRDWAGSQITEPKLTETDNPQRGTAVMTTTSFPIGGVFVRSRNGIEQNQITRVGVAFNRMAADGSAAPREAQEPCLPSDVPTANAAPTNDSSFSRATFRVPADQSRWPCNGRYLATATGYSSGGAGPDQISLVAELTVAVRPVPVDVINVAVDDDNDRVTVTWEKLTPEELAVDAIGYRVERAGPADSKGVYGFYRPIGDDIAEDRAGGEGTFTDTLEVDGKYRYRVLSMRDGADGPVFASGENTAVADATITPAPTKSTTTTTTEPGATTTTRPGAQIGSGRRPLPSLPTRSGGALPAPPTTIDPGFDPELDYDGAPRLPTDSPELAGEDGLSIINTEEGSGAGLLGPLAGALVLIGWAGHIVYLNRLAKQL